MDYSVNVEFVGGPLDGHVEAYGAPTPFLGVKLAPGRTWRNWLAGILVRRKCKATSHLPVAIYELCDHGERVYYRYLVTQLDCEANRVPQGSTCAWMSIAVADQA